MRAELGPVSGLGEATDSCESRLLSDEGVLEADGVIGESMAAWMRSLRSLASCCGGSS